MSVTLPAGALIILGLAAGCRMADTRHVSGSRLQVRWTGADTAAIAAPATAEWCDSLGMLEVRAAAADTGVALAIYPRGAIAEGTYLVRPPEAARAAAPSAAIALRWYSRTAVQGFQGVSGELSLRRGADGTLAGRFSAKAKPAAGGAGLTLTGSFEGLRQHPAARGCYAPPPPDSTGGVH
jgi:hypothetical protein